MHRDSETVSTGDRHSVIICTISVGKYAKLELFETLSAVRLVELRRRPGGIIH